MHWHHRCWFREQNFLASWSVFPLLCNPISNYGRREDTPCMIQLVPYGHRLVLRGKSGFVRTCATHGFSMHSCRNAKNKRLAHLSFHFNVMQKHWKLNESKRHRDWPVVLELLMKSSSLWHLSPQPKKQLKEQKNWAWQSMECKNCHVQQSRAK